MRYQILQANIIIILWQTVRRITREILRVKGLKHKILLFVGRLRRKLKEESYNKYFTAISYIIM